MMQGNQARQDIHLNENKLKSVTRIYNNASPFFTIKRKQVRFPLKHIIQCGISVISCPRTIHLRSSLRVLPDTNYWHHLVVPEKVTPFHICSVKTTTFNQLALRGSSVALLHYTPQVKSWSKHQLPQRSHWRTVSVDFGVLPQSHSCKRRKDLKTCFLMAGLTRKISDLHIHRIDFLSTRVEKYLAI